jgi:hypothetical protein
MKKRWFVLLFLAVAAAVGSCVYDFDPQIDGEGGYMIVEGNIVIGEISQIRLSYSWSLVDTLATQDAERMRILYQSKMHVEDSNGGRYENDNLAATLSGIIGGSPVGYFDMRKADPSLEYRLVIENANGTYASTWARALSPGQIDSLSFEINNDNTLLSICVSTHTDNTEPSFYQWKVDETWEYHAESPAVYKYLYTGDISGEVVPLPDSESTYRCWTGSSRSEIMTASSEGLSEDRLVNHKLYSIGNRDQRISVVYQPQVTQMRITEDAYRYWEQMNRNGQDVGGLFSPEPSELRGNVANVNDPSELVLGYVGVMTVTRSSMYVINNVIRFYRYSRTNHILDTLNNPADYLDAYLTGKRPTYDIWNDMGGWIGYEWWPEYCVDCRMMGGTTRRPPEWPL